MLIEDILWDTFHTEDLDLETLPVRERILDVIKSLFVDLVHVDGET